MPTKTTPSADFLKVAEAETEKSYQEHQQRCENLRKYNKPLLHFIFSINIHEGSFLNLESIEGWEKFINLHTMLFNKFFYCEILPTEKEHSDETIIPEQFLMRHVIESGSFGSIRTCTYRGVKFDVWTNGKDFEIIIDPTNKDIDLKFDQGDIYIKEFFSCWAGEALVKSLHLDKFVDQISMHDILGEVHEKFFGYKSIYDSVLDLTFTSFIVYTYPEDTKFDKLINNSRFSKVSENMWINNWVYLCDRGFYPPFYHYRVYLGGHCPEDYSGETHEFFRILYKHMRYWSMIFTLENFMGIIPSFPDTYHLHDMRVKKSDAVKSLLGKERDHQYISFLRKMRSALHDFLYLGLGSSYRGLENDASEQYTPRYIAGEYLHLFEDDKIDFTKNALQRVNKKSVEELKKDLNGFWSDLERRINLTLSNYF